MIDRAKFLEAMKFPREWEELGMFPDELSESLLAKYEVGHEEGSEHDRNGAFHWWLRQSPSREVLVSLVALTLVDPDPLMAADVREYIARSANADNEVRKVVGSLRYLQGPR